MGIRKYGVVRPLRNNILYVIWFGGLTVLGKKMKREEQDKEKMMKTVRGGRKTQIHEERSMCW